MLKFKTILNPVKERAIFLTEPYIVPVKLRRKSFIVQTPALQTVLSSVMKWKDKNWEQRVRALESWFQVWGKDEYNISLQVTTYKAENLKGLKLKAPQ